MGTVCASLLCCAPPPNNLQVDQMDDAGGVGEIAGSNDVDQKLANKFSRQNAALGAEVTQKMTKMRALVLGCNGTGTEVVKNLILQGIGGVTLHDPAAVKIEDLGVNFFLTEADVGKTMGPLLVPRFKELNPLCDVKSVDSISAEVVSRHSVMIVCRGMDQKELLQWDDFCRRATPKAISFVYTHTGGVFGSIFVDHGPSHVVFDNNGQQPMVRLVDSIETGPEALVRLSVPDGQAPGSFPEGAYVEFSDVEGCTGIMTHQEPSPCGDMVSAWKTSSKSDDPVNTIRIGDTSSFPPYVRGGLLTEKKVGSPMPFGSFAEALQEPGFPFDQMVGTDLLTFGSELQIHLALHAAMALKEQTGRAITVADKDALIAKAKELMSSGASKVEVEVSEDIFTKFVTHLNTPLQAFCAFLGGVVAQEVVKCSGKFTPIKGFFHIHSMESLPETAPTDTAPLGCRYDHLIAIYGKGFLTKLQNLKYFMVGCGALGCEFFKNFALNGVCCGEKGLLTVTDADRIELSNLTRQFLFREHNVGQPKSKAASEMAQKMNPAMQVKALEMFVGAKTEEFFNDSFWQSVDGICNALDNMEARFYVDEQCVKYELPLLESGTMGPAGNVDPVVPNKTQTYRDGGMADEGGGIPMCTLRNFPHLPDHCIEWARDQFELLFVKSAKQAKKFQEDPAAFIEDKSGSSDAAQSIFEIRGLLALLKAANSPSVESAAQLAFDYFHLLYRDKIQDLITAFPETARVIDPDTKQDKGSFWSGHKRFPKAAVFDTTNESHWRFQLASTALFAAMLGAVPQKKEDDDNYLKDWRSKAYIDGLVKKLKVPEYVAGAVNTQGDDTARPGTDMPDSKAILKDLCEQLMTFGGKPLPALEEADFEKDDDFNFHIDFITQCANLRADNYHISNSDFQKVKLVAGRIVPAIATTTAAVCGLVILELFKIVLDKPSDQFRTRQVGLAVNTYTSFEPNPPKAYVSGEEIKKPDMSELPPEAFDEGGNVKKEYFEVEKYAAYPEKHTVWSKLSVPKSSITLDGFKAWLKTEHKLDLKRWGFILGWARKEDEETGKEVRVPVSTQIYPLPGLDFTLFPDLGDSQADAMKKIMSSAAIPQAKKMQYLNEWKMAKQKGELPKPDPKAVRGDMTLKEVLLLMDNKAEAALQDGTLHAKWGKAISGIAERKFWLIPPEQTPSCNASLEDGSSVDVRFMAAIRIPLVD